MRSWLWYAPISHSIAHQNHLAYDILLLSDHVTGRCGIVCNQPGNKRDAEYLASKVVNIIHHNCMQITTSLQNLGLAVQGLALMSTELDAVAKSLLLGRVPELWLNKSFPSLKPLAAYVKEVCPCLLGAELLLDVTERIKPR